MCVHRVTNGFVDCPGCIVTMGCLMKSYDPLTPSEPLTGTYGCPSDIAPVTAVCLAMLTNCSPVGGLTSVSMPTKNLDNTSSWTLDWFTVASRNSLFSSLMAYSSSSMDEVTDVSLWVSSILCPSSFNHTVMMPLSANSSSRFSFRDTSLAICNWDRCPWGPQYCSKASTSCLKIHPMDNNSSHDAAFKSTSAKLPFARPFNIHVAGQWLLSHRSKSI